MILSDFVVHGSKDNGYKVTNTLSGTRFNINLQQLPKPVDVITAQFIQDIDASTMYDMVSYVPGLAQTGLRGLDDINQANLIARGYTANIIYRNGFISSGIVDPLLIDRIEVIKGPSSVFSGPIEPGGTTNIITKRPPDKHEGSFSFGYGSFDRYRVAVQEGGPLNGSKSLKARGFISYENMGMPVDFAGQKRHVFGGSLVWAASPKTEVQFDTQVMRRLEHPGARTVFYASDRQHILWDIRPSFNRYGPESQSDLYQIFTTTTVTHAFNESWSIRAGALYTYQSLFRKLWTGSTVLDASRRMSVTSQYEPNADSYNILPQVNLLGKFDYWGLKHRVIVGTEYYYVHQKNDVYVNNATLPRVSVDGDGVFTLGSYPANFRASDIRRIRSHQSGGTISNVWSFAADRGTLLQGLRWTEADTVRENLIGTTPSSRSNSAKDDAMAQSYGVSYQVIKGVSPFVSYSESFNPQLLTFDFAGNLLKPTRGKGWDYGIKFDIIDGRVSGSVVGYQLTRENEPIPDPDHTGFNIAEGESESQGVEVGLTLRPLDSWQIVAGYANIDSTVTKSSSASDIGTRRTNVPKNQYSIWNRVGFKNTALKGLRLGVGVIHADKRRGNSSLADVPGNELPAFTRVDVTLNYALKASARQKWDLGVSINNVFDKVYLASANGFGETRAFRGTLTFSY